MIQSMPDVSPSKWHLAHTTWFFEVFVLSRYAPGYTAFDERYGYLFNSYYNKLGNRHPRPQRGMLSRPSWDEVQRYRDHVNAACLRLIRQIPDDSLTELTDVIILGLNHEQQHQELIVTDIKHVLWSNPLMPAYHPHANQPVPTTAPQKWFEHRGGLVQIGCDPTARTATPFCFDSETPRHDTYVRPFRLAGRPVTCGEYREFMDAGGYDRPEYWLSDGWSEVEAQEWRAPLYWHKQHGEWLVYTLAGVKPVIDFGTCLPCQLLRGRGLRRLGRQAPADRSGVGAVRPHPDGRRQLCRNAEPCTPPPPPAPAWDRGRCTAMSGNGPPAPTPPTPATRRLRERSASITASSCAIRWCCAAAPAPRRATISGRPTATSSRPTPVGSSPASGSRKIFD